MRRSLAPVLIASTILSGCAELQFSARDNGGVPFARSKPYLIVNHNGDCTTTATVQYIADLEDTRWVRPVTGYGSSELKAEFEDGMLKSFGQTTDTKGPETGELLAKVFSLGAFAPAAKAVKGAGAPPQCSPAVKVYKVLGYGKFEPVDLPN